MTSNAGSFIFGVDLDGVCADYTEAFAAVVAAEKGCRSDDLPRARSWSFEEWGIEELGGFERLHRIAVLDPQQEERQAVLAGELPARAAALARRLGEVDGDLVGRFGAALALAEQE